jgi:hypothetical protein
MHSQHCSVGKDCHHKAEKLSSAPPKQLPTRLSATVSSNHARSRTTSPGTTCAGSVNCVRSDQQLEVLKVGVDMCEEQQDGDGGDNSEDVWGKEDNEPSSA